MAFTPIHLLNLAELKSRRGNATDTTLATVIGLNYPPIEAFAIYIWNNLSTETPDDNEIVQPTIGGINTGRWYRVDLGITSSLVVAALGFSPYDSSNPEGFISNYTETDPIWVSEKPNYRTKTQNDSLYEGVFSKNTAFNKNFGNALGTVTEGNDLRVLNGQTSFSWGNHALAGYLLSTTAASTYQVIGNYAVANGTNLQYIAGDGSKISFPSIPSAQVNSDWTSTSGVSQILNKPVLSTVAISGNYNDLINKPIIPVAQVQTDWNVNTGLGVLLNKPTTIGGYGITDFNTLGDSRWSLIGHTHTFASLTSKPTTLTGYGILDAYPLTGNPSAFLTGITSAQVITALTYTPVTNARTITINGTSFDLTTNRSWNVGDVTTSALTTALSSKENSILAGTNSQYWRGDKSWQTLNSTIVPEGTNLYYTDTRSRSSISLTTTGNGAATYSNSTGVINIPTPVIPFDYTNTAAVAGGAGNVTFYLTSDKTSTGTALYTNVNFVCPIVNDSTQNYTYSWSAYNPATKSITVNVKVSAGLNVALVGLTLLGVPANVANGTNVQVLVKGN